jgi:hypothetical protein
MRVIRQFLAPALVLLATFMAPPTCAAAAINNFPYRSDLIGLVTQAPAGNPFGAAVNNMVSASFYFQPSTPIIPTEPITPGETFIPAFTATLTDFRATFSINGKLFYDQTFINGLNFLTFTNGLLTDLSIHFQPGEPFTPGEPFLPALVLLQDPIFFTEPHIDHITACSQGAVCGTLDASGSAPRLVSVPEPAGPALIAIALAGLAFTRRKRL